MSSEVGTAAPLVEIRGLVRRFETGGGVVEVLKGIDFEIHEGDRIAIVGQSGVGKSTLLHILGTLDHPTEGCVRFRGEDVFTRSRETLSQLRNRFLGFVFQFHHLLPEFSAVENVMMPGLIQGLSKDEMRTAQQRDARTTSVSPTASSTPSGSSRAASASGSPSRAPWFSIRRSSWRTSRRATSIPRPATRWPSCCSR